MKFCSDKLSAWSARDNGAIHLADLEGLELGNFDASQVLSNIPDLGNGVCSLNTKKCIMEDTKETMRYKLMKEYVKGEEAMEIDLHAYECIGILT